MPPLGQLPSLEYLYIGDFQGVETIRDEFYGNISLGSTPFPSLKRLVIRRMPKWKKWSFIENQKKGGCYPRLEELTLRNFDSINSLQLDNFPFLEELRLEKCQNL